MTDNATQPPPVAVSEGAGVKELDGLKRKGRGARKGWTTIVGRRWCGYCRFALRHRVFRKVGCRLYVA